MLYIDLLLSLYMKSFGIIVLLRDLLVCAHIFRSASSVCLDPCHVWWVCLGNKSSWHLNYKNSVKTEHNFKVLPATHFYRPAKVHVQEG